MLILEIHMVADDRHQPHGLRPAIADGKHIHRKGIRQTGLFIKQVQQVVHIRAAPRLNDDADPLLRGLVGNIRDVICHLALYQRVHIIQKLADAGADHRIRDLGDDDVLPAALCLLDLHPSAELDPALSRGINGQKLILVRHDAACRKIRSRYVFHHLLRIDVRIFHIRDHAVDQLAEVVRRDARGHADRDALRPVQQQVRHPHRKDGRLRLCLVKIGHKIHDILVEIGQERFLCQPLQARLRVAHSRRAVPLDGTEITMSVH